MEMATLTREGDETVVAVLDKTQLTALVKANEEKEKKGEGDVPSTSS